MGRVKVMSSPGAVVNARRLGGNSAGARQATLRENNLSLVLKTVAASPGISRAGVAGATALTRSTVSRLVDELVASGVLAESEPVALVGRGRPATPLTAGDRLVAFGLQINAGYLAARVVTLGGQVLAERISPGNFVNSDPTRTIGALTRLAARIRTTVDAGRHTFVGAGLALPGLVSGDAKLLLLAPNLGWSNVDLRRIARRLHIEPSDLVIGNEADFAAHLVATPAPGRHSSRSDFIYLSGEIGIGGAAVLQGRLMTGRHGWAGEMGHVCVDPDGPPCRCGSTGCLEQYAGRRAMNRTAGLTPDATPDQLAAAVRSGDVAAGQAIDRAAWAIGVALASVVNVLDIPVLVLGGNLEVLADLLTPGLEAELRSRVLSAGWVRPTVEKSEHDPAPGAKGAAIQVLERVIDDPDHWITRRALALN